MDMIGRIRRMHGRGKKSEREIARTTGLSRNTVAEWLHEPLQGEPKYRRGEQPGKLTAGHEALKQALKVDGHRPRHERRTARSLFAEIKAGGYDGPLSQTSCRFPDLHGSTTTHEPKPTLQRIPRPSAEQGQTARPA